MYYTDFSQLPKQHYDICYADPPWSFGDKMRGHSFSIEHEYQTQPLKWIQSLPVRDFCKPSSALLLWVPSPLLPDGLSTMKAWGFKFVTVAFCWSKRTTTGKDAVNLGRWTMGNVELCLLGRRGKIQRVTRNVRQLVHATRTRHSAKPPEVRARIETLFGPDTTKIELFARGAHDGWDQFGDTPEWPPSEVPDSQLALPNMQGVET